MRLTMRRAWVRMPFGEKGRLKYLSVGRRLIEMSDSKKLSEWVGTTGSHGFRVVFFENEEQGLFIANIDAWTPGLAQVIQPGQSTPSMQMQQPEKLTDTDLEILKAKAQVHIRGRYGEIFPGKGP